jgi:hypothetical protein
MPIDPALWVVHVTVRSVGPADPGSESRLLHVGGESGRALLPKESNIRSTRNMDVDAFPRDLLEAQTAWYATYWRLANAASGHGTTEHRRRLQQLSLLIAGHPYWQTPAGTPAARMALKEIARAQVRP